MGSLKWMGLGFWARGTRVEREREREREERTSVRWSERRSWRTGEE